MSDGFSFDKVSFYIAEYGQPGIDDQRAVENFVICEPDYLLPTFISQLYSISKGQYEDQIMDQIAGKNRKVKYGSYENWARLMVLWINDAKKKN